MVMVVEDNGVTRKLYRAVLLKAGYKSIGVGSLAAARVALEANQEAVQLILMDVQLPDGLGHSLIEEIQTARRWTAVQDVPIVLCTADDRAEDIAMLCGSVGYLQKPVPRESLVAMVRKYLPSEPGA